MSCNPQRTGLLLRYSILSYYAVHTKLKMDLQFFWSVCYKMCRMTIKQSDVSSDRLQVVLFCFNRKLIHVNAFDQSLFDRESWRRSPAQHRTDVNTGTRFEELFHVLRCVTSVMWSCRHLVDRKVMHIVFQQTDKSCLISNNFELFSQFHSSYNARFNASLSEHHAL